jgi:hypothetical protein
MGPGFGYIVPELNKRIHIGLLNAKTYKFGIDENIRKRTHLTKIDMKRPKRSEKARLLLCTLLNV